jgi:hypothetical protein
LTCHAARPRAMRNGTQQPTLPHALLTFSLFHLTALLAPLFPSFHFVVISRVFPSPWSRQARGKGGGARRSSALGRGAAAGWRFGGKGAPWGFPENEDSAQKGDAKGVFGLSRCKRGVTLHMRPSGSTSTITPTPTALSLTKPRARSPSWESFTRSPAPARVACPSPTSTSPQPAVFFSRRPPACAPKPAASPARPPPSAAVEVETRLKEACVALERSLLKAGAAPLGPLGPLGAPAPLCRRRRGANASWPSSARRSCENDAGVRRLREVDA